VLNILSIFEPIREELELVEQRLREAVEVEHSFLRPVLSYLLDSGGKRIRPALVILASKFHDADADKILPLAASVELLHTATLVHDDLLDGSFLRRGNPTLNASLNAEVVVLVGDYLFARAADLAAATSSVPIVSLFAQTLMIICNGELRHALTKREWRSTKEEYFQSIYSKTASLFAASTEAAGVLSGAPASAVEALRAYGYNLGMAFQILDDILDFTGDEEELGKPIGSDLRQGTVTLPLLIFLETHPEVDILSSIFDELEGREEKIQALVDLVRNSAAIASARDEAERFTAESKRAIQNLPANEYRQVMFDLADYLLERRR
jgi:geranylgeranyl pyrophosphate synthase